MTRTFLAALLAVCGMTASASAQSYFYSGPYTSYYALASYSNYSYTTGYGPLRVFDPRWWAGAAPYRAGYAPAYYGSTAYTASYAPTYTAGYSPMYTASYSPVVTTGYYAPTVVASNACCSPCVGCSSCASGNCASGNCALNYVPDSGTLRPQPDPASSGASGSKTFQSESNGNRNNDPQTDPRTDPRTDDGFEPYERGAGYRPESEIKQKAPADLTDDAPEAEAEADAPAEDAAPAGDASGGLGAPGDAAEPDASLPALNLDSKVTSAPSLLRERLRMKARFGSPQLARAKVDPATIPAAAEVRLVKK